MRQFDRLAAALLTLGLMMSAAQAADYGADPLVDAPSLIPPEEIGTGWYLRGDIGYMRNTASGRASPTWEASTSCSSTAGSRTG